MWADFSNSELISAILTTFVSAVEESDNFVGGKVGERSWLIETISFDGHLQWEGAADGSSLWEGPETGIGIVYLVAIYMVRNHKYQCSSVVGHRIVILTLPLLIEGRTSPKFHTPRSALHFDQPRETEWTKDTHLMWYCPSPPGQASRE